MKDRSLEGESPRVSGAAAFPRQVSHDPPWPPVVPIGVQGLVAGLVAFDPLLEIQHGVRLVAVAVVRTGHLHFLRREVGEYAALPAAAAAGATLSPHHDVGRDDAGVVAHRLDEEDLRTNAQTHGAVQTSSSAGGRQRSPTGVAVTTLALKSFSAPKLRIMSLLSRVVLVASKTWKEWREVTLGLPERRHR